VRIFDDDLTEESAEHLRNAAAVAQLGDELDYGGTA
jgi:hypothetical protein